MCAVALGSQGIDTGEAKFPQVYDSPFCIPIAADSSPEQITRQATYGPAHTSIQSDASSTFTADYDESDDLEFGDSFEDSSSVDRVSPSQACDSKLETSPAYL